MLRSDVSQVLNMNQEKKTLPSIYEGYIAERKTHLSNRWINIASYVKRAIGIKSEFILLLSTENKFQDKMYEWVSGHISVNELSVEEVKNTRISLRLFKEELTGRYWFLILFVILLSLSSGFYEYLDEYLGKEKDLSLFLVNGLFAILAVLERGNVISHIIYCNQLDLFLEKWIDQNKLS